MLKDKYSMSFTTGGLFYNESVKIAVLYLKIKDWAEVRDEVLFINLLQQRTENAAIRMCREIISRLKLLTDEQIGILVDGNRQDQQYMLWVSVCRRYRFIYEFAVEVVREKFLRMDYDLKEAEYDVFFNRKAEWHDELDKLTPLTRKKQRQVVFKILREADIISAQKTILPVHMSQRLVDAILKNNGHILDAFPMLKQNMEVHCG
ncbi:MAG: DUF1819 family protein [Deltaproteobacteria bacterium]|nr:DUF1819 family protein [Deltaproteobacteria bacterium]